MIRLPLLLIDDDPLVGRLLRVLFDSAKFDLDHAETGQDGIDRTASAAREAETAAITQALTAAAGNKSAASKALRTDYKTLHLKMQRYGIKARNFETD